MKLGSLFDGSGGFPLAGSLCGIEPVWAAEVEPYPIAVTRSRFPKMLHFGDVSKINGAEIEPVDVITFGSPCQDLSVAGKRAGLKHEDNGDEETTRSGLFMEAIRIIKEMRRATNGRYPTFAIWENVPGAFSSNKGEDFRIVLEEFVKIKEPTATMPAVQKGGWSYADAYMGDGWSIAYRTFDAQYWGVPQRRRRIYLVADFRGERAHKILFKREGLRGYFTKSGAERETTAADAQGSSLTDGREGEDGRRGYVVKATGCDLYNRQITGDVAATLSAFSCATNSRNGPYVIENHPADSRVNIDESGTVQTLTSRMGTGGGNVPMVMECFRKSSRAKSSEDATTWIPADVANTLNTFDVGETRCNELVVEEQLVFCLQGNGNDRADTAGCNGKGVKEDVSYTLNTLDRHAVAYQDKTGALCARDYKGVGSQYVDEDKLVVFDAYQHHKRVVYPAELHDFINDYNANVPHQQDQLQTADGVSRPLVAATHGAASHHTKTVIYNPPYYIVRRLTPTECARLQGFADKWGHPDKKDDFTDEEYRFWLEVRNTHAEINGKAVKDYTKDQMLTWYNKLHSDGNEYKMWGNGIALPCALYVMQGIADTLKENNNGKDA